MRERALLLLKFRVNLIAVRTGESIALQAPREYVEVDVRYGLP